ncbi:MAG: aldehyde dehydrogenase family protein [Gammaproteobacteria bacterium]|nr:aldehyde dehydrogenase family protein [Gammaproteobacteria bacterium]MBU2677749.1 aldehyde dehydrogenase family protein [Gammaproteobacteria bacterium]NNC56495.1 aldehyde dehydrogenase family protein [Woeseiaceae bacterium]NNL51482.1 aldehyde dehydrogenase family protein [Woeseiaceae bacterium]
MQSILDQLGLESVNDGTWSGGSSSADPSASIIESINPATGKLIASVRSTSQTEYNKVIAKAQESFITWRNVPAPVRGEAIRNIANELRKNKDALGSLVALEMGKIKAEGDGEVQEMIDIADFAVGQSRMLYGRTMHSERPQHRMYEQWHPLGVVGTISAFNFPVAVYSWNSCIAAICGNVSVWKPSPKTPLCGVAVQRIFNAALADMDLPPVFFLINDGSNELAQQFVGDARVNLVSFTGSCAVGRQVGERVAGRMGKSLLELGGNNAIIVDEHANLELAVPAIVFGSVGTAGQRCTSTRRVIAHRSRFDDLKKALVKAYGQVRIGDPLDPDTLMGPLIDEASVARIESACAKVRASGGEVLCGGERIDGPGHFITPAIAVADNDSEIVQTETFGPILYLIPFDTLEDAIAMQNGVVQGLSSAIFTDSLQNAEYFLSHGGSDCGIANVNIGTSGAEIGGAFGGEKETGGGREAGSDAWKAYMRRQTNTINWGKDLPLAQGINFDL